MTQEHLNFSLLKRFALRIFAAAKDLFAEDIVVVWRVRVGWIFEVWDIVSGQLTEGNDAEH